MVVDLPCRIRVDGGLEQAARVLDLSEGGASIAGAPAMADGANGSVRLEGAGAALSFTVRHTDNGVLHVAFREDAAGTGQVRSLLNHIEGKQAA